jgi:cellulose/xylan binding protein with CBM9 domain
MNPRILIMVFLVLSAGILQSFPQPQIPFDPEKYVCYTTAEEINIDGKLQEDSWQLAEWTKLFVDIEGELKPLPSFETKVKMLWDQDFFYFAATMKEPHIWAKLTERDAVIFYDNDFEIFIDPQGDTHEYYEFEMNALNTVWDLLLNKPYRDKGCRAIDSWDIQGLKSAVNINGTINDPTDIDTSWEIEIAIPWKVLEECSDRTPPEQGDQWRVNFSRVEWEVHYEDGNYHKLKQPENNWVWSPQGLINMHYPEMWGFVQFSIKLVDTERDDFIWNPLEGAKWALRQLYYRQREYEEKNGFWTENIADLRLEDVELPNFNWPPEIQKTTSFYEAVLYSIDRNTIIHLSWDGKVWIEQ